jgi:hypothetical protein
MREILHKKDVTSLRSLKGPVPLFARRIREFESEEVCAASILFDPLSAEIIGFRTLEAVTTSTLETKKRGRKTRKNRLTEKDVRKGKLSYMLYAICYTSY